MMDFSAYPDSNQYYAGSERKKGILINDSPYMLKFQKKTAFGIRANHVCEYLGSHIFSMLGFDAQETYLGTYQDEQVVACKDFILPGLQFVPFNDVGESTLDQDKERYQYEYVDIMQMLRDNTKLTNVQETISTFWRMFIVDAFIGNFDRHGANWGFLKENNAYRLAPIFDNGSCLYPNLVDDGMMQQIMASKEEMDKRVYTYPTSQVKLDGQKSSYYQVIHSLAFPECNEALNAVYHRIDMEEINQLVCQAPFLTEVHQKFLQRILRHRYDLILRASYVKLAGGDI